MNTVSPQYLAIKSMFSQKVNRARQQNVISHRQYLTAMSILSNPNFNNKSARMLETTLSKSY